MNKVQELIYNNLTIRMGTPGAGKTFKTVNELKNEPSKKLVLTATKNDSNYSDLDEVEVIQYYDFLERGKLEEMNLSKLIIILEEKLKVSESLSVIVVEEAFFITNLNHFEELNDFCESYPNVRFILITQNVIFKKDTDDFWLAIKREILRSNPNATDREIFEGMLAYTNKQSVE